MQVKTSQFAKLMQKMFDVSFSFVAAKEIQHPQLTPGLHGPRGSLFLTPARLHFAVLSGRMVAVTTTDSADMQSPTLVVAAL